MNLNRRKMVVAAVSCHTGMPYLLARQAPRRVLHEKAPTMHETGLRDRLRARAGEKPGGARQQQDGCLKGGWQWSIRRPRAYFMNGLQPFFE